MACQANKLGMMHESKGQHIGKAPSLHQFFFTSTSSRAFSVSFIGAHQLAS